MDVVRFAVWSLAWIALAFVVVFVVIEALEDWRGNAGR